ncbi:MAG: 2-phospho-L-lactate transferase [Rhodocyclaceae bacterium]|nr:2-phospho-L-lactate transferase [Rhodocyclaceae bacterium]
MKRYLALCGGVGGAKLALGLAHVLAPGQLTVVVNTGDDFEHLGLSISPDLDTVTYTLAGLVQPGQGWGRDEESFAALDTVGRLGGDTWFRLGDKDIGLHLVRRTLLGEGLSLSAVTDRIARRLGVAHAIAPMSDGAVRTLLDTDAGPLSFQHYFVRERCAPVVTGVRYAGAEHARPSPALAAALADPALAGIVVCPSNPYLSIGPILALPGVRRLLAGAAAPVVAVAPIVGRRAIKGPTAKLMRELGVEPTAAAVAAHYADFLDGYLVDPADPVELPGVAVAAGDIVMNTLADKTALARRCLDFCDELAGRP